jgi:hypothetical protein
MERSHHVRVAVQSADQLDFLGTIERDGATNAYRPSQIVGEPQHHLARTPQLLSDFIGRKGGEKIELLSDVGLQ